MTKKELETLVKELERRIKILEERPIYYFIGHDNLDQEYIYNGFS